MVRRQLAAQFRGVNFPDWQVGMFLAYDLLVTFQFRPEKSHCLIHILLYHFYREVSLPDTFYCITFVSLTLSDSFQLLEYGSVEKADGTLQCYILQHQSIF